MQRYIIPGLCSLTLFATQAEAQRFNLRKPPEVKNEFSVGVSMLTPADISFKNLGGVSGVYDTVGVYDDTTMAADSTTGTDKADGRTYNVSFSGLEQVSDANGNMAFNGNYVKASATKGEAVDGMFTESGDSGNTVGMELQYTRYLTRARKFGITFAISTTGFTYDKTNTWDVNLVTRSTLIKGSGLTGLDGYKGSYTRPGIFTPALPAVFFYEDGSIDLGSTTTGKSKATGAWDVKASYVDFRFGALYNLSLTRRLNMRVGAGLVGTLASSTFRWSEYFNVPYNTGTVTVFDVGRDLEMHLLYGVWSDVGAHYRINRNVTMFGSMEYKKTTSFEQNTSEGHRIEYDSSNQFYAKTGFTWAF